MKALSCMFMLLCATSFAHHPKLLTPKNTTLGPGIEFSLYHLEGSKHYKFILDCRGMDEFHRGEKYWVEATLSLINDKTRYFSTPVKFTVSAHHSKILEHSFSCAPGQIDHVSIIYSVYLREKKPGDEALYRMLLSKWVDKKKEEDWPKNKGGMVAVGETIPMPGSFDEVWHKFYFGADGEGSIVANLMEGGKAMVPAICQAVTDRKMRMRRYAISTLGHWKDRRAILTLETIYADSTENALFRGDALRAIFCIDQKLGKQYAKQVLRRNYPNDHYLKKSAIEIMQRPELVLELWEG